MLIVAVGGPHMIRDPRESQGRAAASVDDPGGYNAPWSGGLYLAWTPDTELFESVCQENNFASTLLVGGGSRESVDRPSQIVP